MRTRSHPRCSQLQNLLRRNATVLDWPPSPSGEFRVLRPGTNGWSCLPGFPGAIHDEPGCFDRVFLQFNKDSMAGRTPNVESIGISYMYGGKWYAVFYGYKLYLVIGRIMPERSLLRPAICADRRSPRCRR